MIKQCEQKKVKVRVETVYTTEELAELKEAVRQQDGKVVETHALRNGNGISVKAEWVRE